MNNDQYNNQSNLTDNAPITSSEVKDVKQQWAFTETPMMKPLVAENIEKKKAFRWTVIFVIICLISANLISATSDIFKSFIGPLGHILGAYAIILACISIYWYKTGRYWITDKVSKVLTTIGCATVVFYVLVIFLRFGLFFLIANKDVFIVKVLSTIGMINLYFSPIVISLVVLIYSSWVMLSYYKKSTSNIEKK